MMDVTFLAHSGFLVELASVTLLFDWQEGELPPLRKALPLLVFASHSHSDHFNPAIFALDDPDREVRFVLSSDIQLTPRRKERWKVSDGTAERCIFLDANQQAQPLPGVTVETFPSTDLGVAFLVTAEGQTIFHAGDLNWWHWAEEPDPWNPDMEQAFRRSCEPLRGRFMDLAMLPLDPRLGTYGFWGPAYFLELAQIRRFLPMHQWGDFAFTDAFLQAYPQYAGQLVPVEEPGQRFHFD